MRRIQHLLIVGGPPAAGKSTFIPEIVAGRLPEVGVRIRIDNLAQWPHMRESVFTRAADLETDHLILHWGFGWPAFGPNVETPGGQGASSIFEEAREVSIITLWTPPARLERQLIRGRLRTQLPPNLVQSLKVAIFRRLPRFAILGIARFPLVERINRRLPGHPFLLHLLFLRIYSRPKEVVAVYRRWFQFCDRHIAKTRAHLIVEFDRELKFYSRDEWENDVRRCEGG